MGNDAKSDTDAFRTFCTATLYFENFPKRFPWGSVVLYYIVFYPMNYLRLCWVRGVCCPLSSRHCPQDFM